MGDIEIKTSWDNISNTVKSFPSHTTEKIYVTEDETEHLAYGYVRNPPSGATPVPTGYVKGIYVTNGDYNEVVQHVTSTGTVTEGYITKVTQTFKMDSFNYYDCVMYLQLYEPHFEVSNCKVMVYDETQTDLLETVYDTTLTSETQIKWKFDYLGHQHCVIVVEFEYEYSESGQSINYTGTYGVLIQPGETLNFTYYVNSGSYTSSNYITMSSDNPHALFFIITKKKSLGTNYDPPISLFMNPIAGEKANFSWTAKTEQVGTVSDSISSSGNFAQNHQYVIWNLCGSNGTITNIVPNNLCEANLGSIYVGDYNTLIPRYMQYITTSPIVTGLSTTEFNTLSGEWVRENVFANLGNSFPGPSNEKEGGTEGTFDDSTDVVNMPDPADVDAYEEYYDSTRELYIPTSAYAVYVLDTAGYKLVRDALFSDDIATALKNYFTQPMDAIISLGRFPTNPVSTVGSRTIIAGNQRLGNAYGNAVNRFHYFDCGTVQILPYWDTALDYNPYTTISIHLPYIGTFPLNTDLVMGKTIALQYNYDLVTGACVAAITADGNIISQYTGNLMTPFPLTGADYSDMYAAIIQSTATAAMSAAAGGMPVAGVATGAANAIIHSKMHYDTVGGALGSTTAMLESPVPYIEIIRPVQSRPRNYQQFKGYVSTVTELLANCSGYTQVLDVHLENITATDDEKSEIESLLKSGVLIL